MVVDLTITIVKYKQRKLATSLIAHPSRSNDERAITT
jgi:hypothetical protein